MNGRTLLIAVAAVAIYFFGDQLGLTSNTSSPSSESSSQTSSSSTNQTNDTNESTIDTSSNDDNPSTSESSSTVAGDDSLVMRDVNIYDLDGNLAYEGDIDLAPVFDRIARGERDEHDNDGSVFSNRESLLPDQPRGYYREYVVRTPGMRSVGPQRLVIGEEGVAFYTADHYDSFTQVR
ncbi:MAG: ribonuclease domain-containing protein [Trueperaceae bacterium]